MWERVLQLLAVHCRHSNLSKPFSAASPSRHDSGQSDWESVSSDKAAPYVVCLDCGRRFDYDWSRMQVMK
jgi:hypothetical protein